jgi:hypothetical protein
VATVAVVSTRGTRRRTALSHVGSIVLLAVGLACASQTPATVPQADGPYIATRPEAFEGKVIGAGYCVDFVRAAAGVPRTAAWREGAPVRRNPRIAPGTAIATFESDGSYISDPAITRRSTCTRMTAASGSTTSGGASPCTSA